jgi:hypothetical protein
VFLNGSPVNTIGGSTPGAGNVISGNRLSGISLFGMASSGNVVQGNTIGTDAGGHSAVRNFQDGVLLTGAIDNLLGGTDGAARNLISGNAGDGIAIVNAGASGDGSGNMIEGNTIGTDVSGTDRLANSGDGIAITQTTSIQIGGTSARARNLISGNAGNGVSIAGSSGISIVGNSIGIDATGTQPVPNGNDGVLLDASPNNVIGGTDPGAGNVISGNAVAGVEIQNPASLGNSVLGNIIGPDVSGMALVRNATSTGNLVGVYINGAPSNIIGGTLPEARNLISGNSRPDASGIGIQILGVGASNNIVMGNDIGTDKSGTKPLGNDTGVYIGGVSDNVIGGTSSAAGNLISGNGKIGVYLFGNGANGNQILGNLIGLDESGTQSVLPGPSGQGILINSTNGTIHRRRWSARDLRERDLGLSGRSRDLCPAVAE